MISCAIAGLGRIGSDLEKDPLREKPASHAGAVFAHPETELIGGADPDSARRDAFSSHWGNIPVYESASAMLSAVSPDILHIAASTEAHPELLQVAAERRVPVVVCEKPLANSIKDVRPIVENIGTSETRVVMNHERRFSRDYQSVKAIIAKETLGELRSVTTRLYMGKSRPVDKVLYHDGTHMLDILCYLTGERITVTGADIEPLTWGESMGVRAKAGETFLFMDISSGRDHLVFELDLSFSEGRIRIGNGTYEIWRSEESPYYKGFRSLKKIESEWTGETGYFSGMMDHAVQLQKNPSLKNESSIEDGFIALQLIESILSTAGRL